MDWEHAYWVAFSVAFCTRQFAPAVQKECTQLSSMKGFQSYVELLACLQMSLEVKKLPKDSTQE